MLTLSRSVWKKENEMKVLIINGSPRVNGNTTIAVNEIFLMKSIALGKEKFGLPEKEEWQPTHFI